MNKIRADQQPKKYIAKGHCILLADKDWPPVLRDNSASEEVIAHVAHALNLFAALAAQSAPAPIWPCLACGGEGGHREGCLGDLHLREQIERKRLAEAGSLRPAQVLERVKGLRDAANICDDYKKREYGPHGTEWVSCEDIEAVAQEIRERAAELEVANAERPGPGPCGESPRNQAT